jgi:UDP-N-acetylglucosamine transferase subunit ALG13
MSTFVAVGNATQPFDRMLQMVAAVIGELPQPVVVQRGGSRFEFAGGRAVDFFEMGEFERLVAQAELVIAHAGAGAAIQAIQAGKVPVVVPRRAELGEHVDDHQLEFARELALLGKAVVATNPQELKQGISKALELQRAKGVAVSVPPLVAMVRERLEACAREAGAGR